MQQLCCTFTHSNLVSVNSMAATSRNVTAVILPI